MSSDDTERPECPTCPDGGDVTETPEAGYWYCHDCGGRGSGPAADPSWWRNDPDSQWCVESEVDQDV